MHTIKSVGVLSVAKVMGAIDAVLGHLFLPFFLLISLVASMAPHPNRPSPFAPFVGIAFAIFAPVFYGAMGFIFGAIGAFLYNLLAKWMGGIEMRLESAAPVSPLVPTQP